MASNLRVDNIQPSTGMGIGIGTANGSVTITGDLSVDTSKGLTVGTGATISGGTNYITASTNGSERVRIDADGNFNLVNTAGIMTAFKYETPALINNHFKSQSTTAGAYVRMYASAGTGQWDIYGNGANLRFSDNASSGNIQMDRPLSMNSQNIIMSSGYGIDFSATSDASGMTSELLDDYEEGTFTPNFGAPSGSAGSAAYTSDGKYVKIGKLVIAFGEIYITNKGSWSGTVTFGNLPFTAESGRQNLGSCWFTNVSVPTQTFYQSRVGPSESHATMPKISNNGGDAYMQISDITTNSSIRFTVSYTTS